MALIKNTYAGILIGIFAVFLFFFLVQMTGASTTFTVPTQPDNTYKNFTFFTATTTTATSTNTTDGGQYFRIAGAKKVRLYFTHGGTATTSTGGAIFNIQATRDGVVWENYNHMIDSTVSSTATSSITTQGATTTVSTSMDLTRDTFYAIRCISTELTPAQGVDGEHTCTASAEF